jgi:hypothetical protein
MEGRCPYPFLYELVLQADATLSRYREIISAFQSRRKKFVDPDFPGARGERLEEHFSPNVLSGKISPDSVFQGKLKDCFLMAALMQLAALPDLIPPLFVDPDISSGCCCLRFTLIGRPYYVIIDTCVPFEGDTPMHAFPGNRSDSIWFCLVEKAYAKLMGGWAKIAGNSPDALSNILGCWALSEKVTSVQNLESHLTSLLKETPLVFLSTPTSGDATKCGLSDFHGYAVTSLSTAGKERAVRVVDPRGGLPTRVFNVPISKCKGIFQSVSCAIPVRNGWSASAFEFDLLQEHDGRFFAGDGPYIGNLPQWKVTFSAQTAFRVVIIMVSKSENTIGFCMCQNRGEKVSYKKLEEVEFKTAIQASCHTMRGNAKGGAPYTVAVSRKLRAADPAHVYCRIEAASRFVLEPIAEPNLAALQHVHGAAQLTPGADDGVPKQWHLTVAGPARLHIRATKSRSPAQHSLVIGVPSTPGRFTKPGLFSHEVRIHPDSPLEVDFVDILPAWSYVTVGVNRVKHAQPSECEFDLYCSAPISLEDISAAQVDVNDALFPQPGQRSGERVVAARGAPPAVASRGAPPVGASRGAPAGVGSRGAPVAASRAAPPRGAARGGASSGGAGNRGRGPPAGDFRGTGIATLYHMMEDL